MYSAQIASLLGKLDRELWIVTAEHGGQRCGLVATFVQPASIVPTLPRMLVGLAKSHRTWELADRSGALALHLLSEQHLDWVWRFGTTSGRDVDKFAGLQWSAGATGSPVLSDANGFVEGRVEARFDTGDRTVFLVALQNGQEPKEPILTMNQLLQLAPPERLQLMKSQLTADALIDERAINQWHV